MPPPSDRNVVDQVARDRASEALRGMTHVDQLSAEKHARVLDQIAHVKEQFNKLETSFASSTAKTETQINKIDTDLNTLSNEIRASIRGIYSHLWMAASAVITLLVAMCAFLISQVFFNDGGGTPMP